jgi:hypothetical protein
LSRPHSNGLFDMTIQNSDHTTRVKVAHEVAEFESPPTPNSGGEKLGSPQRWGARGARAIALSTKRRSQVYYDTGGIRARIPFFNGLGRSTHAR